MAVLMPSTAGSFLRSFTFGHVHTGVIVVAALWFLAATSPDAGDHRCGYRADDHRGKRSVAGNQNQARPNHGFCRALDGPVSPTEKDLTFYHRAHATVLLGIVQLVIFAPVAMWSRFTRSDPLDVSSHNDETSQWLPRSPQKRSLHPAPTPLQRRAVPTVLAAVLEESTDVSKKDSPAVIITQRSLRISIRRTRSSASTMTAWLTTRCANRARPLVGQVRLQPSQTQQSRRARALGRGSTARR